MKKIRLTHGLHTLVDDDVYQWASKYRWSAQFRKGKFYAARKTKEGLISLHREIQQPKPGQLVDHRDGDSLDNQRHNLRVATPVQNAGNRGPAQRQPYKGVLWSKKHAAWRARLRNQTLGYFPTAEAAARAHDAKAKETYGEFAWLNFGDAPILTNEPEPLSSLDVDADMALRRARLPPFAYYYALRPRQKIRLFRRDARNVGYYYFCFALEGRRYLRCTRTATVAKARVYARIMIAEIKLQVDRRKKMASESADASLDALNAGPTQSFTVSQPPIQQTAPA